MWPCRTDCLGPVCRASPGSAGGVSQALCHSLVWAQRTSSSWNRRRAQGHQSTPFCRSLFILAKNLLNLRRQRWGWNPGPVQAAWVLRCPGPDTCHLHLSTCLAVFWGEEGRWDHSWYFSLLLLLQGIHLRTCFSSLCVQRSTPKSRVCAHLCLSFPLPDSWGNDGNTQFLPTLPSLLRCLFGVASVLCSLSRQIFAHNTGSHGRPWAFIQLKLQAGC